MAEPAPNRPVVLITEPIGAPGLRMLEQACTCIAPWRDGIPDQRALRAELPRADAVVVRLFKIGAAELDRAPRLKVVAKHGAGLDNIDCAAAALCCKPPIRC